MTAQLDFGACGFSSIDRARMTALQDAKNEALRKQAYVERIVQPNLPDYAIEPRRFRGIISTLLFCLVVWGVLTMLVAGVREHQQ